MTDDVTRVGYVGLGHMGGAMAVRLARAGFATTVWNRSPEKGAAALAAGATWADSPAAVTAASDVVITCLTDTAAVEAVVFGPDGIAAAATPAAGAPGKILVDMSSMRPDKAVEFAGRLRAETGMGWVDAPVSGGVPGATNGTLAVMAGGSPEDFARVEPVITHLAGRFTRMGPSGAGQSTKLVNQMIVGCTIAVLAEATQFARSAGIDAERIPEALAGGRADSLPLQQFMPKMIADDRTVDARLDIMLKDLNTVQQAARDLDAAIPMTSMATELHRLLVRRGLGPEDNTAMARLYLGSGV